MNFSENLVRAIETTIKLLEVQSADLIKEYLNYSLFNIIIHGLSDFLWVLFGIALWKITAPIILTLKEEEKDFKTIYEKSKQIVDEECAELDRLKKSPNFGDRFTLEYKYKVEYNQAAYKTRTFQRQLFSGLRLMVCSVLLLIFSNHIINSISSAGEVLIAPKLFVLKHGTQFIREMKK